MTMHTRNILIIILIVIVVALTVVLTLFVNEVNNSKQDIETDRTREQPSVGGQISINILNGTDAGNTTNETSL